MSAQDVETPARRYLLVVLGLPRADKGRAVPELPPACRGSNVVNIGEATAWNHVLQSMETGASEGVRQRGVKAAEYLASRARVSLAAGPVAPQVASFVETVHSAVEIAADHPEWAEDVRLPDRAVTTARPTGGVL